MYTGNPPDWATEIASGGGVPGWGPPGGPYAVTTPPLAVAFFLAFPPLSDQTIHTDGDGRVGNKVLWAVKGVRVGEAVVIDGRPFRSQGGAVVHYELEPARVLYGPGGWFGSGLDVPTPGCWHFLLHWSMGSAQVDIRYS